MNKFITKPNKSVCDIIEFNRKRRIILVSKTDAELIDKMLDKESREPYIPQSYAWHNYIQSEIIQKESLSTIKPIK